MLMISLRNAVLLTFIAAAGLARATNAEFDTWADDFAARWVRQNPQVATRAQYFSRAARLRASTTLAKSLT